MNDLRIPLRDKKAAQKQEKQQFFTLCLFQIIKYKWPGTKDKGIDGAVPSYQLLLACRDEDAVLSLWICQGLSQYLYPISLTHWNYFRL